jgi:tetratricopeptide (TPR) repeat protein
LYQTAIGNPVVKHKRIARFIAAGIAAAMILQPGCSARHNPPTPLLVQEMYAIAEAYADIDPSIGAHGDSLFDRELDNAAKALLSDSIPENEPLRIIDAMNRRIFDVWGISFSDDRDNVRYLLPHLVWREKRGSCVGMSLLYLLLAEKSGVPLYAVRAPSHLFVRYDNGRRRFNIETLRRGECMSDDWYRRRYAITDTARYPLCNLSRTEAAAVVIYNLGTVLLHDKKYDCAIRYLRKAAADLPDFPEAQGNLALAYEAKGEVRRALKLLIKVRSVYPSLEHIDRTVGSLQLRCGEYRSALYSFDAACRADTLDPEAYYGRAMGLTHFKRYDEACAALDRAAALRPGYSEAHILKGKLDCPAP